MCACWTACRWDSACGRSPDPRTGRSRHSSWGPAGNWWKLRLGMLHLSHYQRTRQTNSYCQTRGWCQGQSYDANKRAVERQRNRSVTGNRRTDAERGSELLTCGALDISWVVAVTSDGVEVETLGAGHVNGHLASTVVEVRAVLSVGKQLACRVGRTAEPPSDSNCTSHPSVHQQSINQPTNQKSSIHQSILFVKNYQPWAGVVVGRVAEKKHTNNKT